MTWVQHEYLKHLINVVSGSLGAEISEDIIAKGDISLLDFAVSFYFAKNSWGCSKNKLYQSQILLQPDDEHNI